MPKKNPKTYSPEFKLKVALAALREEEQVTELCEKFDVTPSQVYRWRNSLIKRSTDIFASKESSDAQKNADKLRRTLKQLEREKEFLVQVFDKAKAFKKR